MWGQGVHGKSLYPSLNFAVNIKLIDQKRSFLVITAVFIKSQDIH